MFPAPNHPPLLLNRKQLRAVGAVAACASVLLVAACGSGSSSSTPQTGTSAASVDLTKQGPVEYWTGKDVSGNLPKLIDAFNAQHPQGKVTLHELPDAADQQRQQMIQNTQIKNPAMGVISVDNVWTAEFAANGWIVPLPEDQFDTSGFLKAPVESARYFNKLYAYPNTTDGGLLYYRKDLLDKYGITTAPTTWPEIISACEKIRAGENDPKLDCYAGQFQKYEGLTVNIAEAIDGAGGQLTNADGKPDVNTPEALKGLSFLTDGLKNGYIPKASITWQEEDSRTAFQNGNLLFLRNWAYVYNHAADDSSSKVKGKFGVAPLPGLTGPGTSSLGGHNLAIATNADNKGTAADFIRYMSSEEVAKSNTLATSQAPVNADLYTDKDVLAKYPAFPILLKSIETAKPRPKVVNYGDATLAIQDNTYAALQGQATPQDALTAMQAKLSQVIK